MAIYLNISGLEIRNFQWYFDVILLEFCLVQNVIFKTPFFS